MKNNFSARLSAIMTESGLSQEDLAKRLRVSQSTIARWLGGTKPQPRSMAELAVAIGVRPAWLSDGEEPRDLSLAIRSGQRIDVSHEMRLAETGKQFLPKGRSSEMEALTLEELIDIVEGMPSQISMANNLTVRSRLVADAEAAARELRVRSSLVIPK